MFKFSAKNDKMSLDEVGGALSMAERLRKAVEEYEFSNSKGQTMRVTISIGVNTCMGGGHKAIDETELIGKADEQLYRAKKGGRNMVCYPEIIYV